MATVITKNGRVARGDLATHDLFPVAKKVTLRKFNRAVRRDSRNIIREQLEEPVISVREQKSLAIQEEALRMECLFLEGEDFLDDFYREQEEHEREMDYIRDYREREQQEQLAYFLDCDEDYLYGLP